MNTPKGTCTACTRRTDGLRCDMCGDRFAVYVDDDMHKGQPVCDRCASYESGQDYGGILVGLNGLAAAVAALGYYGMTEDEVLDAVRDLFVAMERRLGGEHPLEMDLEVPGMPRRFAGIPGPGPRFVPLPGGES